jgi:energy-coupling factor transport system permease protein
VRRRRPIAYRRRPSPLHAARASVGAAYGLALAGAALVIAHPLALAMLLGAVLAAGFGAGVGEQMLTTLRHGALGLVLFVVLVNVLVDRGGLTVFLRLGNWGPLGQMDLTTEAALYGVTMAVRLLIVVLAFVLVTCAVDPDELLRMLRRVSNRSALTATLTTRLVPVLFEDARRLEEAQRCRPDVAEPGPRTRVTLLRAVVSSALDRSLDVAAALEVRGYGSARRPPRSSRPWSRHDLAFALSAVAIGLLAGVAAATSMAPFVTEPLVHGGIGPGVLVLALSLLVLAVLPFADRRGIAP